MGKQKTIYCTLDTETLGGAGRPQGIYNIGATIHYRDGTPIASVNILIAEYFRLILEKAHYGKKTFYRYQEMINAGETTMVATEKEAISLLENLLTLYNVKYVMAYNTSFDLCKTACKFLIENRQFIDIYQMAHDIFQQRPSYKKFCKENKLITKTGNPKESVEAMYAFLSKNPLFQEEHTAFSDANQEREIFVACVKQHKPYKKNAHRGDVFGKRSVK